MNITPLDITQKEFRLAFRGFSREEVEGFLAMVAAEFEALVKENTSLKEENQRKNEEVKDFRSRERVLQETLVTAQRASEDIREASRKEAQITLSDAELQAEKIVQGAHGRFLKIVDDINELKRQRVQLESGIRMIADSHMKLLEAFREPARDDSVPLIASRKKTAPE